METSAQKNLAIAELQVVAKDVSTFRDTAEGFEIANAEHVAMCGDFVKQLKFTRTRLEDKRKSLVQPLKQVAKDIDEMFAAPRKQLDEVIIICKDKMTNFQKLQIKIEEERKRREREEAEAERKAAEDAAKKLREHGDETTAATIEKQAEKVVEQAQAPAKAESVKGESANVVTTKTYKAQVIDLRALALAVGEGRLPVEVIGFHQAELNKIARDLQQEMETDGVKFYLDVSTTVR